MNYNLELDNLIKEINKNNHKQVLLQLPDGLKPQAKEIVDTLRKQTKADFFIYFGTCYGACDSPLHLERLNFDLNIQWGHTPFKKIKQGW